MNEVRIFPDLVFMFKAKEKLLINQNDRIYW